MIDAYKLMRWLIAIVCVEVVVQCDVVSWQKNHDVINLIKNKFNE